MTNAALRGKPDAGNPHVRFDEGEVASAATPRRGSLLYKRKKAAAVALAAAAATMVTAPLASANGDEYQFIDPATWPADNPSYSAKSTAIALEAGALRVSGASGDLEARSRSRKSSNVIALDSTKFHALMVIVF